MQSSQTSPQHPSSTRSSPLSEKHTRSADTSSPIFITSKSPTLPAAPKSPSATSNAPSQPPITPSDSSSRSSATSPFSPRGPTTPGRGDLSVTHFSSSILSAAAPDFQSRLFDAPIDLHQLVSQHESPLLKTSGDPVVSPVIGQQPANLSSVPVQASVAAESRPSVSTATSATQTTSTLQNNHSREFSVPTLAQVQPSSLQQSLSASVPSASSQSSEPDTSDLRTPNVYINGLPPNYPEEDLYKMTCEFGAVVSVRTFTRHVCDKPSGYGFVLFETVDAAEKCIETLRKYRNLHPSFSKQIHKIPGTVYSSSSFSPPAAVTAGSRSPADSFKARMEQLKDTSSTNLYMEGLPMSINERALAALVTPYRIMSNRFFQTKLSNPPRIIAFVRLETRAAAEEIIERLHGRHVYGWQDKGARISVRFADTSEQRELRRVERVTHEGDHSPARITIAQAALLNLKGTQLSPQAHTSPLASPDFGLLQDDAHINSSLLANGLLSGHLGTMGDPLSPMSHASGVLPYQQQQFTPSLNGLQDMSMLMDGQHYNDFSANASLCMGQDLRIPQHMLHDDMLPLHNAHAQLQLSRAMNPNRAVTHADNGFTPMERMLLQAHAERQQAQQFISAEQEEQIREFMRKQTRGLHGSIHSPSGPASSTAGTAGRQSARRLLDVLQPMSEDDFHASAEMGRLQSHEMFADVGLDREAKASRSQGGGRNTMDLAREAAEQSSRLASDLDRQLSLNGQQRHRNQTHASHPRAETDAHTQALHTRSTTLPSQYLSSRSSSQNFLNRSSQHNNSISSSILSNSANSTNRIMNSTGISNASFRLNSNGIGRLGSNNTSFVTNTLGNNTHNNKNPVSRDYHISSNTNTNVIFNTGNASVVHNSRINGTNQPGSMTKRSSNDTEDDADPLVSPALTYSARTPASLSPATPYSGFFPSEETFDGPSMGAGDNMAEARLSLGEKQKMHAVHQ